MGMVGDRGDDVVVADEKSLWQEKSKLLVGGPLDSLSIQTVDLCVWLHFSLGGSEVRGKVVISARASPAWTRRWDLAYGAICFWKIEVGTKTSVKIDVLYVVHACRKPRYCSQSRRTRNVYVRKFDH